MMKMVGLTLTMLMALGLGGCGDDDAAGEEGGGNGTGAGTGGGAGRGSTSSGSTADDIAMCMMMGTSGTSDCEGIDEYTACVQEACDAQYKTCLGQNYESGDFSGGMCESLADCTETASDPCTCDADAECINCFIENLVSCSMTCPLPDCTGGGGGGSAGAGGLPSSDKTCDDLEACCNSLDGATKDACLMNYNLIKGSGDLVCSAAYSVYAAAGCN